MDDFKQRKLSASGVSLCLERWQMGIEGQGEKEEELRSGGLREDQRGPQLQLPAKEAGND